MKCEHDGINVVFSELVMPGKMDGLGLARHVRKINPAMPIVLATGYSDAARKYGPSFRSYGSRMNCTNSDARWRWRAAASLHRTKEDAGTSRRSKICPCMQKDHGIVQDERGRDQPKDKNQAQKLGVKEQKEAAERQVKSPREPAGGE